MIQIKHEQERSRAGPMMSEVHDATARRVLELYQI